MKYIDEYRNKEDIIRILGQIKKLSSKEISLMEVCGGHTMSIQKFGIRSLLPENINLLSGPGCPVCVSDRRYIDKAIAYARLDDVIIATYGDLIRVPGSTSSLQKEKAEGRQLKIVYSIVDAIEWAEKHPDKKVVFLSIGFETTTPGSAAAVLMAKQKGLKNFFIYSAHKVMPPAMDALVDEGVKIDGYIAPGHVSVITGSSIYKHIPDKYGLACVISGFEPLDMLQSIYMLVKQIETNKPQVEIQYKRVVKPEGNLNALAMIDKVFELKDEWWRGFGIIHKSGHKLRKEYENFDAEVQIPVDVEETKEEKGCICGEILKGLKTPKDCPLFRKVCKPENPVGACMVSNEGSCHAYYRFTDE